MQGTNITQLMYQNTSHVGIVAQYPRIWKMHALTLCQGYHKYINVCRTIFSMPMLVEVASCGIIGREGDMDVSARGKQTSFLGDDLSSQRGDEKTRDQPKQ